MLLKKIGLVVLIVASVVLSYVIMTGSWEGIYTLVTSGNSTPNIENYVGLQQAINSAPLWLYFLPAIIGAVSIFLLLREKPSG